jgi:hypothetical protein
MSRTVQRRGAQALGTAAIFMLALSGPATARPDQGGDARQASVTVQPSQEQYECHYLNKCTGAASSSEPAGRRLGGSLEFLQLGAGVLAGVGLAGAGMAAASRRNGHGHAARPA